MTPTTASTRNPWTATRRYLAEVIAQLRKVITPSRSELGSLFAVVLVFLIITTALVLSVDALLGDLVLSVFAGRGA